MERVRIVRDNDGHLYGVSIVCPGCSTYSGHTRTHCLPITPMPAGETESPHVQGAPHWTFNGDLEQPTLQPSILATHPLYDDHERPAGTFTCHSFVTGGQIQFLGDCTHSLANQTVELPEFPADYRT